MRFAYNPTRMEQGTGLEPEKIAYKKVLIYILCIYIKKTMSQICNKKFTALKSLLLSQ